MIWKDLSKPFSNYSISNTGLLMNKTTRYIFNNKNITCGYVKVSLIDDFGLQKYKLLHILVAQTFLVEKENCVVHHKDSNRLNNNVDNLEYITQKQNCLLSSKAVSVKFRSVVQYDLNMNLIKKWINFKDIPYNKSAVRKCCVGKQKTAYGFIWRYDNQEIVGEIWKNIPFNGTAIAISNKGRVRLTSGKITYGWNTKAGYFIVKINNKSSFVHRLVAFAFLNNYDDNLVVNHKDRNKQNNCVENLEWVTQKENSYHGKINWTANPRKCKVICSNGEIYSSLEEASKSTGITKSNICMCCQGKRKSAGGYKWDYFNKNEFNL